MRIILFRSYEHLMFYIILCVFCALVIFYIYQIMHCFSNKFKSLPSKFPKCFCNKNENKTVSSFFFDACFDCQCVNVALNNSSHSILILVKSIAVINFMKEILLAKKEMVGTNYLCYNSMAILCYNCMTSYFPKSISQF